jgi:hypothetical protein
MRYINKEILLRNRQVFVKARDRAFEEAGLLVDDILALCGDNGAGDFGTARLQDMMARLVDRFYHARYYARLSAGGNNVNPPPEIDYTEQAYIDHVETMYSYSRSINRFVRHETLIDSFVREHPEVSENLKSYLAEIRKSDANLIHINLRSLRDRMRAYRRFMNYPHAAKAETRAAVS